MHRHFGLTHSVAAFVYAVPGDGGVNEVLIAVMSGYSGSVVFVYGTIDDAVKDAIQNAPLEMEGSFLKMEAKLADGNEFNIVVSKAR